MARRKIRMRGSGVGARWKERRRKPRDAEQGYQAASAYEYAKGQM